MPRASPPQRSPTEVRSFLPVQTRWQLRASRLVPVGRCVTSQRRKKRGGSAEDCRRPHLSEATHRVLAAAIGGRWPRRFYGQIRWCQQQSCGPNMWRARDRHIVEEEHKSTVGEFKCKSVCHSHMHILYGRGVYDAGKLYCIVERGHGPTGASSCC